MKRFTGLLALAAVLAVILAPVAVIAQTAASFEALAVSSTSVGITAAVYETSPPKVFCILTLATDQVRWRVDGVAPTASVGHIFDPGGELRLYNQEIRNFRAIRVTTDAVLSVTCE